MEIKISDYIVQSLVAQGVHHVFVLSGGANLALIDALQRNPQIKYVCTHHEQAASIAAEAYSRVTSNLGACIVTTGPGGTNAITGVLCAWQDSIPCIFISGQSRSDRPENKLIRQLNIQGLDITAIVGSITKYSVTIRDRQTIKYHLQKALYLARHERPGPVWIDLPLDLANALVDPDTLPCFDPPQEFEEQQNRSDESNKIGSLIQLLQKSKRPLLLIGGGVHLSKTEQEMLEILEMLQIPYVCTWNIQDIASDDDPLYMGSPGIFGTRYANFAIQNCDLLLCVGSRLANSLTGHNYKTFARAAKKVVVDIDQNELTKETVPLDLTICMDAKDFLKNFVNLLHKDSKVDIKQYHPWRQRCQEWRKRYPATLPEYYNQEGFVNSYVFTDVLSEELKNDDVIVLGVGTSFTGTFQSFKPKRGQRIFHAGGAAPMGYCLPGSIGACFARGQKRTICITGDGSIQLNLQELQTIVHHNLPVKIFLINNNGYVTVRTTQDDWFESRHSASSTEGGVSFPDMISLAKAYGINNERIHNHGELRNKIKTALHSEGPFLCEIMMSPHQPLIPYITYGKTKKGKAYQRPLEDMSPLLSRDELRSNMIIDLWEEPD
ncbi:MAG: thiamine pyrophosphate-binding protein [Deltaproteobacteria bacterium]|nr:thiamine pyrophosphate-binding protein [Deltaproteobacteria bacterium]